MVIAESDPTSVIFWSVVMIAMLVGGLFLALRLKKKLKSDDAPSAPLGFTLSDLRDMHRAGQLTDAEFEKAKEKIVLAAQKAAERVVPPAGAVVDRDSAEAIRERRRKREDPGAGLM